ncbi:MAG: OsmC family protein [Candidatus Micrarchaeota archaeon]
MRTNNVDLGNVMKFAGEIKADKANAIKIKKIEGEWNFSDGAPQFAALMEHQGKKTLLEADGPTFLGGSGMKPDPVQYCLFGLASCFAQTFASVAAEKGLKLTKLKVSAENKVNLLKALGMGDEPIVESVKLTISATGAPQKILEEIEKAALERCPGVYCLTKPIKLETELMRS